MTALQYPINDALHLNKWFTGKVHIFSEQNLYTLYFSVSPTHVSNILSSDQTRRVLLSIPSVHVPLALCLAGCVHEVPGVPGSSLAWDPHHSLQPSFN